MVNTSLSDLLTEQLRDLYDAEKQLTKALPRLAKAAADKELAQSFLDHAQQTQEQVRRIEKAFEELGTKAKSKPCAAMKGLIEEGREAMTGDLDDSVRDLALIAAARRVEHYEMAAYDALATAAKAAKQQALAELLVETLREETETDRLLAGAAKRLLKEAARSGADGGGERSKAGGGRSNAGNGGARKRQESGHLSATSTDHEEIRQWAEERGAKPACVQGTGKKGDTGLLRLEFPGKPKAKDDRLSEISWEDFFEKFDERGLALVFQDRTADGRKSNFNKLISREVTDRPKSRAAG